MATATAPNRSWYKRNEIAVTPWLFLLPGIIFFALYVIFPIFQSFWISFHEWDGLGEKTWVGTANYERLLGGDRKFETSFWNNVRWLVLYLLAIPMGLFISLFLNQKVFGIRFYKSLFFFPLVERGDWLSRAWSGQHPRQSEHGDVWHHRCGALAADGLLYDLVSHGSELG